MGHFVNSDVTANSAKAIHAGVNCVITSYTLGETASGSCTIDMCALPAGAQVISAIVRANHAALQAGGNAGAVRLYPTIGGNSVGNIIATSTLSYQIASGAAGINQSGLGVRCTGSANVRLQLQDLAGTGTASTVFTLIIEYVAELDGD